MRKTFLTLVLVTTTNWFHFQIAQAEVATDFDGDGKSDITAVEIQADGTLAWKSQSSSAGTLETLGKLGQNGNHIILGTWTAAQKPLLGTVRLNGAGDRIIWNIQDESGVSQERDFGATGDMVLSGADFDGNGIADAAVVRLKGKSATWDIAQNLFTNTDPLAPTSLKFGKNGDRVFFANIDGSLDWMGLVRKGPGRNSTVRYRNLKTGEIRTFNKFPAFASNSQRPRPFPIKQADGIDVLGFELQRGSKTTFKFTTAAGQELGSVEYAGAGVAVVGDFNDGSGEELAFQNSKSMFIYNPVVGETREVPRVSGILVDEINVNLLGGTTSPPPDDGGGNTDPGPPTGNGPKAECSSTRGWSGSLVYKTVGSNHFSDARRNAIGLIAKIGFSGPFPSCIAAIDTKGNVIAKLGLYQRGAGWAARWYNTIGCGGGTQLNGNAVASKARANTGSSMIYMSFDGTCFGPIDASKCVGSQQC